MTKNVALIDFHAAGHHPTYLRLYTETLLGECRNLLVIAPDREALKDVSGNFSFERVPNSSLSRFWRWRGRGTVACIERFLRLGAILHSYEKRTGSKIDRVIFACLYDGEFKGSEIWGAFFRWPFSALYLHPVFNRQNQLEFRKWMALKRLSSLAVLDETVSGALEELTGKAVVEMPDVVDADHSESGLLDQLIKVSAGKPVVLLSGFLHPQKGVMDFVELALLNQERFCFALVGSLHLPDFPKEDQEKILKWTQEGESIFLYPFRVLDERHLNGIIRYASVIFAAYRDWPFSSNAIGKAAAFGKPILVSKGFVMADRIEKYRLGCAVEQGDLAAMNLALREFLQYDSQGGNLAYLEDHSLSRFSAAVINMLRLN